MPYLKPIKGHTSVKPVKKYLEKDGRALAMDFINVCEICDEGDWADQMEWTRKIWGNDKPHGDKRARTYAHYVLSPNPEDNISLEDFRGFMMEFLDKAFEDMFEIAVIYHDDNKNNILHAHFIVNNTNVTNGKRLAPWLTNEKVNEIRKLCEVMAAERGWSNFLDTDDLDSEAMEADIIGKLDRSDDAPSFDGLSEVKLQRNKKPFITDREVYYTKSERELIESGAWSWKEDLRSRIKIARELSTTEEGFLRALNVLDVEVSTNDRGDYRFVHPDNPKWQVNGYRLGKGFSRNGIRSHLADEDMRKAIKPTTLERAKLLAAFDAWRIEGIRTVGWMHRDVDFTLAEVADSLCVINEQGIRAMDDFGRAMEHASSADEAIRLSVAKGCMELIRNDSKVFKANKGRLVSRPQDPIENMSDEEARKTILKARDERMKDAPFKPKRTEDRHRASSGDSKAKKRSSEPSKKQDRKRERNI